MTKSNFFTLFFVALLMALPFFAAAQDDDEQPLLSEQLIKLQSERDSLNEALLTTELRMKALEANAKALLESGKTVVKPVSNVEDANRLAEFLFGFIMFVLVGVSTRSAKAKAFIDKYITKGVLSVAVSIVVGVVGVITSKGSFDVLDAMKFVTTVFGAGGIMYIATKQKANDPPSPAPAQAG